jgi:membrane protease YdiL (CAAX protease family)
MDNATATQSNDQYSLAKILGIWFVAAVPMAILAYVATPAVASQFDLEYGLARWFMVIVGLFWLFVMAIIILNRELGTLSWSVIRKRMWYQTPIDPKTGEPNMKLLWWAVPAILINALVALTIIDPTIDKFFFSVFPFLEPLAVSGRADLGSPELVGQWWIFGVWLISMLFNYFIGEEWLFRGVLLPKMGGVFGRWAWLANVVLFATWHWHQPWDWIAIILSFSFAAWASQRFKCNWIFFSAHIADGLFMTFLILGVMTGLAFQ